MESNFTARPGHAALRRGRRSEHGRIYLITFTTKSRERIFVDWELAANAVRAMLSRQIWRGSRLLCWVLMPDHWHGLVELGAMDELSALVNRIKGSSARGVNELRCCAGHVWSKGFHDRALRSEDQIVTIARYLVCNPIRAGLVDRVGAYAFWDAIWLDDRASLVAPAPPA